MGLTSMPGRCAPGLTVALLALAAPLSAAAAQTEQIAACAGVFQAAAHWAEDDLTERQLSDAADRWLAAGTEQARADGQFYPAFYANTLRERALGDWTRRGRVAAESAGLTVQVNACFALDPVTHVVLASDN